MPSPKSHRYDAIVPSGSLLADASNVHTLFEHDDVNDAVGAVSITVVLKLSKLKVTGALVLLPPRLPLTPELPETWSSGCVSVTVRFQLAGSAVPAIQALPCSVVGFAPVTRKRSVTI